MCTWIYMKPFVLNLQSTFKIAQFQASDDFKSDDSKTFFETRYCQTVSRFVIFMKKDTVTRRVWYSDRSPPIFFRISKKHFRQKS
eukprot:UN21763